MTTCEICGERDPMCMCLSKMTPLAVLLKKVRDARDDERASKGPSPEVKL